MRYQDQHGPIAYDDSGLPATTPAAAASPVLPASGKAPAIPSAYLPLIREAARAQGIHPAILSGLLARESSFDPAVISGRKRSRAGALGIAQFMPATAREYGINPLDPSQAIYGAARYLRNMLGRFGGDYHQAVAAYNAGPAGNFSNPETAAYVPAVQQFARQYAALFTSKEDHDRRGHDVGNLRRLDNAHRAAGPQTTSARRLAQLQQEEQAIKDYRDNGGGFWVSVGRGAYGLGLLGAALGNKAGLVDDNTLLDMADTYNIGADPRQGRLGRRIEEADGVLDTTKAVFSDPAALSNLAAEQLPGLALGGPASAPLRQIVSKAATSKLLAKAAEQALKHKGGQLAVNAAGRLATGGSIAAGTTFAQGGGANIGNTIAEQQALIQAGKQDHLDLPAAIDKGLTKTTAEAGTAAVLGSFLPHTLGKHIVPKLASSAVIGSTSELAETIAGAAATGEDLRKSELVLAGVMGAPFGVIEGAQAMRAGQAAQVDNTRNQQAANGQAPVTPVQQPAGDEGDPLKAAMRAAAADVHPDQAGMPAIVPPTPRPETGKTSPVTESATQRVYRVDTQGNASPEFRRGQPISAALPAPTPDIPVIAPDGTIYPDQRTAQNASQQQAVQDAMARVAASDQPDPLAVRNHPGHTPQAVHDALPAIVSQLQQEASAIDIPATARTGGNQIDPARDDLLTALAKLGGLRAAEVQQQLGNTVMDDSHALNRLGLFGKPVLRREGGMALDEAAQRLAEHGYLPVNSHGQADSADLEAALLDYDTPRYTHIGQQRRAEAESASRQQAQLRDPAYAYQRALDQAPAPQPGLTPEPATRHRLATPDDGQDVPGFDGQSGRKMAASEPVPFSRQPLSQGQFGPIFQGFTNQPEQAISRLIAAREGEVPDAYIHPELGPIALVYGDENMGLRHIIKRRGMAWVDRIPGILRHGELVRDEKHPRAYLVDRREEPAHVSVIRLQWDGHDKTWLMTAYEDDQGKFARQSRLSNEPTAGAASRIPAANGQADHNTQKTDSAKPADLRAKQLAEQARQQLQGMLGKKRLAQLEQSGLIIHDTADSLPAGLQSLDLHGVQGLYDGRADRIHLLAANLASPEAVRGVLLHEILHRHADTILNPRVRQLLGQRLAATGKAGEGKDWFDAAKAQALAANTPDNLLLEEIAAYAIEQYSNAPRSLPQRLAAAVRDFIAGIRVRLHKAGVKLQLTDADLTAMARASLLKSRRAETALEQARYSTMEQERATRDLVARLEQQYPGLKLDLYGRPGKPWILSRIQVPEAQRNQGVATQVMQAITAAADQAGATVALSPDSSFGASKSRLKDFYQRFGFIENKGRQRDFEISETMYRTPDDVRYSREALPAQIEVNGRQRPTLNEEGKRIYATMEGVKNFWRWVDEIGRQETAGNLRALHGRGHLSGNTGGHPGDQRRVGADGESGLGAETEAGQNAGRVLGSDVRGPTAPVEIRLGLGQDGRPRTFYHGTRDDITAFDLNHPNRKDQGWLGTGIYLSSAPEVAEGYANNKSGAQAPNVMPLYAMLRNPFPATLKHKQWLSTQSRELVDRWTDSLIAQGYDGVVMTQQTADGPVEEVVVFNPVQVKSATGNNGNFDPANPDIRFSRRPVNMQAGNFPGTARATPDEPAGTTPPDFAPETPRENLARQHVNRFNRVEKFEASLSEAGIDVPHWQSTNAAEIAYHGRRAERLADFRDGEAAELAKTMAEQGIQPDRLDWYLLARHAEERNRHIAAVNPDMPDGGSGLTTAQAQSLLAGRSITASVEVENAHGKITPEQVQVEGFTADEISRLHQAASIIDRMTAKDRELRIDYGLEDAAKVDQWQQQWQYYVPLAGKAGIAEFGGVPGRQSGFSVRGGQKRAAGRKTIAPNITEQVIRQVEDTINRGEVNRVSSTLVAMAHRLTTSNSMPLAANGKPVIELDPQDLRQYFRNGNLIRSDMPALSGDDIVVARIDGKDVAVRLHDPALADAMRNLDAPQLGTLLDFFAKGTRYLSTTFTAGNPAFWAAAYLRDITNIATIGQRHGGEFVARALWRVLPATWHGITHEFGGKTADPEFDYFRLHGGRTGFIQVERNLAAKRNELIAAIQAAGPLTADTAPAKVKLLLGRLWHYYLATGAAFETGIRYAAYLGARDQGKSQPEAAMLSKELLTNFNRKGQGQTAAAMAALFPFYNAALQGTRNETAALGDGRVQLALATFGAMVTMSQLLLFASIEEDKRRELLANPTFQEDRQRNILIPAFGTLEDGRPYYRIPLVSPGLMSLVTGTGISMAEMLYQQDGAAMRSLGALGRGIAELAPPPLGDMVKAGTLADEGNGTRAALVAAAPGIAKPALQLAANISHTGQQLIPGSPYDSITPDAYKARSRTRTSWASDAAIAMNRATGGNSAQSGYVDISPESMLHLIRGYGGGIASVLTQGADALSNPQKGWLDAPVINRFSASPDSLERGRTSMAMATLHRVSDQLARIKRLQQNGEHEAARQLYQDMQQSGDSQLGSLVKQAERQLSQLARRYKALGTRKDDNALQARKQIEKARQGIYSRLIQADTTRNPPQ